MTVLVVPTMSVVRAPQLGPSVHILNSWPAADRRLLAANEQPARHARAGQSGVVGKALVRERLGRTWRLGTGLARLANSTMPHKAGFRAGNRAANRAIRAGTSERTETIASPETESDGEVDMLLEGVSFGQLCDEFECVSSPAVERTARQLARDILDLREDRRQLGCYGANVKYKDPLRSFTGRDKLKRPSWILNALDKPQAVVLEMVMRNTSELVIRWRVRGRFQIPGAADLAGPLTLTVLSAYTLNQISGQVTEQTDQWEFEGSSPAAMATFWSSRAAWTVAEGGRDAQEAMQNLQKSLSKDDSDGEIYADPTDPRKFFQQSNPNSEFYQIAFFIALIYLLVQFLRFTL